MGGDRLSLRAPPPALGQHTEALLRDLGYADTDIDRLRRANVVGARPEYAGSAAAAADS